MSPEAIQFCLNRDHLSSICRQIRMLRSLHCNLPAISDHDLLSSPLPVAKHLAVFKRLASPTKALRAGTCILTSCGLMIVRLGWRTWLCILSSVLPTWRLQELHSIVRIRETSAESASWPWLRSRKQIWTPASPIVSLHWAARRRGRRSSVQVLPGF